ncbi:ribonuclease H-like domain-containing protein, partial [Tanacetum coccineum]
NDLTVYTQRLQELILLCTRMVPNKEDRVERFIRGLPNNIQGNVIAANPVRFQDAIRIANQLMDKKLQGYATRSAESERGWKVTQGITVDNNRHLRGKILMGRIWLELTRLGTMRGEGILDLTHFATSINTTIRPRHFRKDYPKLRNKNHGNQTRNRVGNKTGNQTGGNEATTKAYCWVLEDFTTYRCWFNIGAISEDLVLLRKIEENRLMFNQCFIIVALDLSKVTNPLQAKGSRSIQKITEQDSPPPTITAMKIPIIKKGEYDIWSLRMRQYICHTDHNLWDIIVDGDLQEEAAPAGEQSSPPAPKTAKQLTAKRNQERVKSILLLAIPDEYLLKFHNVLDAKSLWAAIKSRFRGNGESKKMQRNVLKYQFENFTTAPNESLDKAYDSQIALIMRNKPDIDQTDIDDLYNNLRVYEDEMERSSSSTSNSQNLAFLSSENTSSTNKVSTAIGNFGVNTAGGTSSSSQVSSTPGADEVVCSFFAQQTTSPPLDNEDLQQIDQDDLEELDIRWQVAMLTVRVQRFIQKTGRNLDFKGKQPVTFDKSKVECYNCHRKGHFAKECKSGRNQGKRSYGDNGRRNATTNEPSSQALVAQDGLGGYDWSNDFDEPVNYALMAISSSSSSSSSDNEVQNCSK